jgi:hypothetical protein
VKCWENIFFLGVNLSNFAKTLDKFLYQLKLHLSRFELQTFKCGDIKLRQSKHTKLFHNLEKNCLLFYIHITYQKFRIKKSSAKVKI